ncbi:MAG TPA: hypothetical protein DEP42_07210 [Ruminococcaceae bacterium]|nr:hypothetical protein [Oscillospiraceae bacterium]
MPNQPVSDEVVHHFLENILQFNRFVIDVKQNHSPFSRHKHKCDEGVSDMRHSERMLLFAIADRGKDRPDGLSVSELSQLMQVKPPSITAPLNALEERGMIQRTQDENDRRIVRIHLTQNGQALLQKNRRHLYERARDMLNYLGVEKAEQLSSILDSIFEYFEKDREKTNAEKH